MGGSVAVIVPANDGILTVQNNGTSVVIKSTTSLVYPDGLPTLPVLVNFTIISRQSGSGSGELEGGNKSLVVVKHQTALHLQISV